MAEKLDHKESNALYDEASKYFPGGVQAASRELNQPRHPAYYLKSGEGARCTDLDGNEYIDYCHCWGDIILGHNNPFIKKHIEEALEPGYAFSSPSYWGNQLARQIVDNHPFIDQIRFTNSSTEAMMSAIRLARGATEKRKVIRFEGCYHGHIDALMDPSITNGEEKIFNAKAGIPEAIIKKTIVLPLNDMVQLDTTLRTFANDIACAIIEPIPTRHGLLMQKRSWLKQLKEMCQTYKVLLIFDESRTGFRIGFDGASGYYNIAPDISVFGNSVGGGLTLGAFGAKKELMAHLDPAGPIYQAGNLSTNQLAMAAGLATLKRLIEPKFYKELNKKTRQFAQGLKAYITDKGYPANIQSVGSLFWIHFSKENPDRPDQIDSGNGKQYQQFFDRLLEKGIYLSPSAFTPSFISEAHSQEDLETTGSHICDVLDEIFKD